MSARPTRHPHAPKVHLGDFVRLTRPGYWQLADGILRIPAGTLGEVFPWETPDWGRCCALKLEGFEHPTFRYFPMALLRPGVDGWPDSIELVRRKDERIAA